MFPSSIHFSSLELKLLVQCMDSNFLLLILYQEAHIPIYLLPHSLSRPSYKVPFLVGSKLEQIKFDEKYSSQDIVLLETHQQ